MDNFEKKVFSTIRKYNLVSEGDRVIVGFSGGVDSTTLLYFLSKFRDVLGIELIAVHVNHLIRDTSYRDEEFCIKFCKNLNVEILSFREDVSKIAREKDMSLEEAGRFVRYRIFRSILKDRNFTKIATAHHIDDNVETFIHRLAKGSSITGLGCMKPKNGSIVRPFIQCYKKEIVEYASRNNIVYVTDETNFDNKYERNYIRNVVLPSIESFFPSFKRKVSEIIEDFWDLEEFIRGFVRDVYDKVVKIHNSDILVDLKQLSFCKDFLKKEVVKSILKRIEARTSRKLINLLVSEKKFDGNKRLLRLGNYEFIREYEKLRIRKLENQEHQFRNFCVEGIEVSSCCNAKVEVFDMEVSSTLIEKAKEESKNRVMWLSIGDAKRVVLRERKEGDSILLGFGKKKIKDILVDEKIPLSEREKVLVVEIDGEVAGLFYSNKVRVSCKFLLKEGKNRIVRIALE